MRFAFAAIALWSCGDNLDVIEPGEAGAEYTAAACRYWARCGVVGSEAECIYIYSWHPDPDLLAAIDAGVITWHFDAASAYRDWVDRLGCDPTDAEHRRDLWYGVYTGTKHDGEPCAFGEECISQECWQESSNCRDACCIGYCTGDSRPPLGRIGDRCRYSGCAKGYCKDSLCVPLLAEGAACTYEDLCDVGLTCHADTCQRLPGPGEPCIDECRDIGQICGRASSRCENGRVLGEACIGPSDCSPIYQCYLSKDGNSYRCQPPTLGDSCFARCALPYTCDWSGGFTCVLPKADGSKCRFGVECASGSCDGLGLCTSEVCI